MEQPEMEPVELDRVKRDAACVIIRVGLGSYDLQGPAENVLVPESHVAWSTVINDLQGEGYFFVTPGEYADMEGISEDEVHDRVEKEGCLFGLMYRDSLVVPLPRREALLPHIDVPGRL
ncbi:hypothetical protein [Geobacter sp. DSM 9736]|uniref:hypothetical protein n=1 Tax=Geobacter sp. DSM 9736 TaxID=1277350 RepID=UPI000B50B40E|nr:hypothetical protein [Geobacter sp. DSM 9736]SNB46222.1 hypothetical protein SAMN06269301_1666 [Geobacter sp. DSM 9736]